MDIDELATEISRLSSEPEAKQLIAYIHHWKKEASTVSDLESQIDNYLRISWPRAGNTHAQACAIWSKFKSEVISYLPGMTVNERLSHFGLMSSFDWGSKTRKAEIYAKLHARL